MLIQSTEPFINANYGISVTIVLNINIMNEMLKNIPTQNIELNEWDYEGKNAICGRYETKATKQSLEIII